MFLCGIGGMKMNLWKKFGKYRGQFWNFMLVGFDFYKQKMRLTG